MIFKSYSGDMFYIEDDKLHEVEEYLVAMSLGDETTMLFYEEGNTGWIYKENI